MEQQTLDLRIAELKMIMEENPIIILPEKGKKDKIQLKSRKYLFFVDINFSGYKKPSCTFQLREKQNKHIPLIRLDILGPSHPNPTGKDIPFSGELIPCPHLHIANVEYGDSIAYPLNSEYANIYLSEEDLTDMIQLFIKFLKRSNVANIESYDYQFQDNVVRLRRCRF